MGRRIFSIGPGITFRGRKFKGLRGWAGKPLHPPLTDVPVGAYTLVAAFDLISTVAGPDRGFAADAYVAGTWTLIGGAIVSLGAAVTGFWDWWKGTPEHTQAWRTANWHMAVMVTVTLLVAVDIALRLRAYGAAAAPVNVTVLSVVVGLLTAYGATYGGSLAYDYGFNVENAIKSPAWEVSEEDVYPADERSATD